MPTQNVVKNKRHVAHLEQVRRQTEAIKIGSIVIIVLIAAILVYGFFIDPMVKAARPVANVNGETVSVARFQAEAKIQRLDLLSRYQQYLQYAQMFGITDIANDQNFGPAIKQIEQQLDPQTSGRAALDSVIDDLLIRQEAKRRNITVSAEEVEQELQAGAGYFPKGTPTPTNTIPPVIEPTLNATQLALVTITPTGDPATATSTSAPVTATNTSGPVTATNTVDPAVSPTITLTPTVTITSTATITSTTTATVAPTDTPAATDTPEPTATPITEAGYKELLKKQLDDLSKSAKLTEDDLRRYYENQVYRRKVLAAVLGDLKPTQEQVWARHILVATEEEAKKVVDRLNKGEDFGNLAKELSTDTGSGAKGGDLGWFATGAMVEEFQKAAFVLKVGEISQPVKSQFGYHIIQALGHENRQLDADGFQRFKDQSFADFLKKQRETSKVEEFDIWKQVVPTEPALPDSVQQQQQLP